MLESMVKNSKGMANWASKNGAFVLTFLAMTGAMILAVGKDADVNTLLPTLLGLYVGQRASQTISAHVAASRDPKCDTAQVIKDLDATESVGNNHPG